jgi:hypothetical protein
MALTDDEKSLLEQLTQKSKEADAEKDFEIEVYSKDGHGARIPFSHGKKWLFDNFGIGEAEAPAEGAEGAASEKGADNVSYFGRQQRKTG